MRFEDLRPTHVLAMIHITGWASDSAAIGALESDLPRSLQLAAAELEQLGLAWVETGWMGSRWWRMTKRGHAVRNRGEG